MTDEPTRRIAIASGYFNPLHVGHLRMMVEARSVADELIVIVNNDAQQVAKIGTLIMSVDDRIEIVKALRVVTDAVAAIDQDATVNASLAMLRERFPDDHLLFVEGGDRSDPAEVAELETCERLGIELVLAVGGAEKVEASSRINRLLGRL